MGFGSCLVESSYKRLEKRASQAFSAVSTPGTWFEIMLKMMILML